MNASKLNNLTLNGAAPDKSRRRFLKTLAYGSLLTAVMPEIAKATFFGYPTSKTLALEHHHTGEALNITYYENGNYVYDALTEVSYFLRDYHNDEIHDIDPALLDQLYDLKFLLGIATPFHIVSGYRSPSTNASLRRHMDGVARHSLHMEGRAVDIRIEGMSARTIRDAALSLESGGVGYYPHQNFVHIDTGELRTWRR